MVEVSNKTDGPVDADTFAQVAKTVLAGENKGEENVSLVFVSADEIKELNRRFRGKDEPTDVLSFNLDEKEHLGEVVICPAVVEENAKADGAAMEKEMVTMVVHGVLHLLGYDHEVSKAEEERMFEKQDAYVAQFFQ